MAGATLLVDSEEVLPPLEFAVLTEHEQGLSWYSSKEEFLVVAWFKEISLASSAGLRVPSGSRPRVRLVDRRPQNLDLHDQLSFIVNQILTHECPFGLPIQQLSIAAKRAEKSFWRISIGLGICGYEAG